MTEWGASNDRPYETRGWCCVEFAIALYNNRIANLEDAEVQHVLQCRPWPDGDPKQSTQAYADLMDPNAPEAECVMFTDKGDRSAVQYNFFKMTLHPKDLVRDAPLSEGLSV